MPLRITRSVGTVFYGGENLDPNNLEKSFDHRVYVHSKRLGHQEHVLTAGDKGLQLTDEVFVEMMGVQPYFNKPNLKCPECGTVTTSPTNFMFPQAQLLVGGPRKYKILRDDARKKQ